MNATKQVGHTPGPWQTVKETRGEIDVRGPDYGIIATVYGGEVANARLIAAAPEMLEALRKIRSLLPEVEARDSDYEQCFTGIWKQCRAAIAKAVGA